MYGDIFERICCRFRHECIRRKYMWWINIAEYTSAIPRRVFFREATGPKKLPTGQTLAKSGSHWPRPCHHWPSQTVLRRKTVVSYPRSWPPTGQKWKPLAKAWPPGQREKPLALMATKRPKKKIWLFETNRARKVAFSKKGLSRNRPLVSVCCFFLVLLHGKRKTAQVLNFVLNLTETFTRDSDPRQSSISRWNTRSKDSELFFCAGC